MIHKKEKLDFLQIKNFCSAEDLVKRMKRPASDQEKIAADHIYDKELVSRIYKELSKLNCNDANNLIRKWAKYISRHFTEEDNQTDK